MKTVLLKALKDDKLQVSEDLIRMENVYNEQYNIENAAHQKRAHEAKKVPGQYTQLSKREAMEANSDRRRFLKQIALVGDVRGLPGLSNRDRLMFHREARRQGLISQTCHRDFLNAILVIGKSMEHVMREVNRLNAETEVESRKGEEEKQAKRLARQKELDDMHRAIMEMGDDGDISGTWILNLPTYFSWGELEWTWEIAHVSRV